MEVTLQTAIRMSACDVTTTTNALSQKGEG
jgi:hypothetical protein